MEDDEPCDPTVPYQDTWQFEQRRGEVRRWMVTAGLTHDQAFDILAEAMDMAVQEMFRLGRDPAHVGSKFLHLVAWRCCLRFRCPGVVPRFPLLEDLVAENTRGPLVGRAPSTEYMAFHRNKTEEARERATKAHLAKLGISRL